MIRVFDLTRPGRQIESRPTSKTKRSKVGQRGLISTIAFNPDYSGIYAAGSYGGTTCVYSELEGEVFDTLGGHPHGVTKVQFSPDGKYLYTGGRRDDAILCWDIRKTGRFLTKILGSDSKRF